MTTGPLARTPLHAWHVARGARLVERGGWQVPAVYTSPEAELAAARGGAAVADVSAFAKGSLRGRAVLAFVEASLPNTAATRPRGVARFPHDPTTLACRLTGDHLVLLALGVEPAPLEPHRKRAALFPGLVYQDATTAHAAFWLLGPQTEGLLARLTSLDISAAALPPGRCLRSTLYHPGE